MKRPLLTLFSTSLLCFGAASARAEGSTDKVSAEALFDEGRKLMAAGKFADACPKFEASQELDPGVGTMLNLADCYEKTGRTASAWAEFRETVSAAHNAGSRDREDIARGRGERPRTEAVLSDDRALEGAGGSSSRGTGRGSSAALGAAIPVDPGRHVIVASAPGKRDGRPRRMSAPKQDHRLSVAVPILPDGASDGAHTGGFAAAATGNGSRFFLERRQHQSDPGLRRRGRRCRRSRRRHRVHDQCVVQVERREGAVQGLPERLFSRCSRFGR